MSSSILAKYLVPQAICLRTPAATAEEVIQRLSSKMEEAQVVKPSYCEAVIAREKIMPTGLPLLEGLAVAVPHTDPEHVLKPGIGVATLETPVEFSSMEDPDEKIAVQLVFVLALLDKHEQIEMLQTIMAVLQEPAVIREIINADSHEALLAALGKASQ
ncbi:PTS sugar transporter subunit IIA [Rhodobacteraceae bacterium RKSG542]|uniref:PTS sugar transporter subunit IIA n=1 Tax=Pseudovibrio flavus TaxID=2529854 RepID=UPI0012BD42CC|nr:PTS sugar transporter subunit IIA [Pseudovibrio flavus]MTI15997.1 PTS sugar transporter subunit IIA [Pseudovibrio flavus]